jgi:hypothetical protein
MLVHLNQLVQEAGILPLQTGSNGRVLLCNRR